MTIVDVANALLLLAAAAGMFAGLRVWQARRAPQPELVRKLFHIGGGLLGITLPWLFDSIVPVLVVATVVAGAFATLRVVTPLREGIGQVLHGVHRESVGEFCYVASFVLLFWMSNGNKLLYAVPLLVLMLADTFAALVGERYGRRPLRMPGDRKTYEGIVAFFLTAFLCIHVPVLLSLRTGRLESLLIGVGVAAMVMMAEAAAWWGLDNLIIPLFAYMLLRSVVDDDAGQLASNLVVLFALAAFMRWWRKRTPLGDDALFGGTLWGYVVWAVGGWRWSLAPIMQLALYARAAHGPPSLGRPRVIGFPIVLASIAGSAFWLLLYAQSGERTLLLPFAACYGANVAIAALLQLRHRVPTATIREATSVAVAKGMLVAVPSVLVQAQTATAALLDLGGCLIAIFAATRLFARLQPNVPSIASNAKRWIRQLAIVAVASALAVGVHYGAVPQLQLEIPDLSP